MIAPSVMLGEAAGAWVARLGARSVLDVGSGSGDFVRRLRRNGIDAFGVDRRPVLVRGDAGSLPFRSGRFDATTSLLVLHYVHHPARAIGEAARILRPGGWIVVADRLGSTDPDHERIERLRHPDLHGFIAPRELDRLLAAAGFRVEHRDEVEASLPLDEWLAGVPEDRARAVRAEKPRDLGTIVLEGPTVRLRMQFRVARRTIPLI